MFNILAFGDIHINAHKQSQKRLEDCLETLEWVFQVGVEKKVTDIIFLGDLFQNRQKIEVIAYQKTFEVIWKYRDYFNLHILLGNHDLWYSDRLDISSVFPLAAIKNVDIIGKLCTKNIAGLDIDFIPYTEDPFKAFSSFKNKSRILCGHLAVDGAQLNAVYNTIADVSVEFDNDMTPVEAKVFKGWERVFLGHYHGAQVLDDFVEYIGSPLELSYSEAFQDKHIMLLDPDTLKREYIKNTFSPRHLIIKQNELDDYDLNNNFVQVIVDDISQTEVMDMRTEVLVENECREFKIKESKKSKADQEIIQEAKEKFFDHTGNTLEKYIAAVGCNDLDCDRLLQVGIKVCSEE